MSGSIVALNDSTAKRRNNDEMQQSFSSKQWKEKYVICSETESGDDEQLEHRRHIH